MPAGTESVSAANQSFYDAFEARDVAAMSEVWEHSERVLCTHPGWQTLHGWEEVGASFTAILEGPQRLQFVLTNEQVTTADNIAWVSIEENLISAQGAGTVTTINIFSYDEPAQRWRMVCHHGSGVVNRL